MKTLYKYLLIILKWIPTLLAICAFTANILAYFDISVWIISFLGGISLIPLIFIFISSYTFKFCKYHRIPLYYVLINMIISIIDTTIGIPLSDLQYLYLTSGIFGVIICWFIISKYKICKN
jgi:hypothetical protein